VVKRLLPSAHGKRLGAQLGLTAILHTWGQNLLFHPHLHCVVTGGGLSPDGPPRQHFQNDLSSRADLRMSARSHVYLRPRAAFA
jgi:hypothetical protein